MLYESNDVRRVSKIDLEKLDKREIRDGEKLNYFYTYDFQTRDSEVKDIKS